MYIYIYTYYIIYIYIYTHTYIYIHTHTDYIYIYICIIFSYGASTVTVSSHKLKAHIFNMRGSNPRIVAYLDLSMPFKRSKFPGAEPILPDCHFESWPESWPRHLYEVWRERLEPGRDSPLIIVWDLGRVPSVQVVHERQESLRRYCGLVFRCWTWHRCLLGVYYNAEMGIRNIFASRLCEPSSFCLRDRRLVRVIWPSSAMQLSSDMKSRKVAILRWFIWDVSEINEKHVSAIMPVSVKEHSFPVSLFRATQR